MVRIDSRTRGNALPASEHKGVVMNEILLVYSLLGYEGSEQEYKTLSYERAFRIAEKYDLQVISRRYKLESMRILPDIDEALFEADEVGQI